MITLKNKKVLLLGLGLHGGGAATARWLHKQGATLVISDLKDKKTLEPSIKTLAKLRRVRYVLGTHREKDVRWADMVVYNPGVPKESALLAYARKLQKPVYNEATLFFDRCKAPIVAVTGTRGKSTTAALLAAMLKKKNPKTVLAGNIKSAFMLDVLGRLTARSLAVLELSSWQLEGLAAAGRAPNVAVVTNLYPDHLNRYRTLADYYRAKKEIFKYQTAEHCLVLNRDDRVLKQWRREAASRVLFFSKREHRALLANLTLAGEHNAENAAAAITVARLFGVSSSAIKSVLKNPPRLSGRLEEVRAVRGVLFVNDTTATTPVAGIAALKRFFGKRKRIMLIAGGADKKLDYAEWGKAAKRWCRAVYLLKGDASAKQKRALRGMKNVSVGHNDLGVVVRNAFAEAESGDVVLFSPAAASFSQWNHEFERGDDFVKAVKSIAK